MYIGKLLVLSYCGLIVAEQIRLTRLNYFTDLNRMK